MKLVVWQGIRKEGGVNEEASGFSWGQSSSPRFLTPQWLWGASSPWEQSTQTPGEYIFLSFQMDIWDCCFMTFSETWLTMDSDLLISGLERYFGWTERLWWREKLKVVGYIYIWTNDSLAVTVRAAFICQMSNFCRYCYVQSSLPTGSPNLFLECAFTWRHASASSTICKNCNQFHLKHQTQTSTWSWALFPK